MNISILDFFIWNTRDCGVSSLLNIREQGKQREIKKKIGNKRDERKKGRTEKKGWNKRQDLRKVRKDKTMKGGGESQERQDRKENIERERKEKWWYITWKKKRNLISFSKLLKNTKLRSLITNHIYSKSWRQWTMLMLNIMM